MTRNASIKISCNINTIVNSSTFMNAVRFGWFRFHPINNESYYRNIYDMFISIRLIRLRFLMKISFPIFSRNSPQRNATLLLVNDWHICTTRRIHESVWYKKHNLANSDSRIVNLYKKYMNILRKLFSIGVFFIWNCCSELNKYDRWDVEYDC